MHHHSRRCGAFLLLLLAALAPLAAQTSRVAIRVSKNVHVSASRAGIVHDEVLVGTSRDPNLLIACSLSGPANEIVRVGFPKSGGSHDVAYVSTDGGKSWRVAIDTTFAAGDNHCAIGPDKRFYFVGIRNEPKFGETDSLTLRVSRDSGRTWQDTILQTPWRGGFDRQFLVLDDTQSPYHGRVYLAAHTQGKAASGGPMAADNWVFVLWRSLRGGISFERPITVLNTEPNAIYNLTWNPVVLSNGWLVFPYTEPASGNFTEPTQRLRTKVLISRDGGDTFDKAVTVGSAMTRRAPGRAPLQAWNSTAVDPSNGPYKDRVYIAWPDQSNGGDSANSEIVVVHSADSGKTWSDPVRVGEYPPRAHPGHQMPITPIVAVNKNGVVGVAWLDRRNFPKDDGYDIRFAASLDGGETWTPSVLVSESPMSFPKGQRLLQTSYGPPASRGPTPAPKGRVSIDASIQEWPAGGHSSGFGATGDGRFHAVWVDNRTGIHQLWSATIEVDGSAIANGAPELTALRDVSDSVELAVLSNSWDAKAGAVKMQVRLRNTSKTAIRGPVKIRVITLDSDFGNPAITGSTNGMAGPGAIFDLTALLPGGVLEPNAVSGIRDLTIHLKNAEPFVAQAFASVLKIDAKVFAGGVGK
jgi:hypothetical protein